MQPSVSHARIIVKAMPRAYARVTRRDAYTPDISETPFKCVSVKIPRVEHDTRTVRQRAALTHSGCRRRTDRRTATALLPNNSSVNHLIG